MQPICEFLIIAFNRQELKMRTIFVFAIIVLCLASIAMSVKPDGNHSPSAEFSPSNNSNPFNIVNDAEKMSVLPAFEAIENTTPFQS